MKKSLIVLMILFLLGSCASVDFYSDPGMNRKTGLKICSAKPYIMVEYSSGKEKPGKTSLIWLPDLSNPQYLKVKPGIGASELKLAFSNGTLTSYGITTESQIPETINSLASLISKSSDAVGNLKAIPGQETELLPAFELYEIVIEPDKSFLRKVNLTDENNK